MTDGVIAVCDTGKRKVRASGKVGVGPGCCGPWYRLYSCPELVASSLYIHAVDYFGGAAVYSGDGSCYRICGSAVTSLPGGAVVVDGVDLTTGSTCCDVYQLYACTGVFGTVAGTDYYMRVTDVSPGDTLTYAGDDYRVGAVATVMPCLGATLLDLGDVTIDSLAMNGLFDIDIVGVDASICTDCAQRTPLSEWYKFTNLVVDQSLQLNVGACGGTKSSGRIGFSYITQYTDSGCTTPAGGGAQAFCLAALISVNVPARTITRVAVDGLGGTWNGSNCNGASWQGKTAAPAFEWTGSRTYTSGAEVFSNQLSCGSGAVAANGGTVTLQVVV